MHLAVNTADCCSSRFTVRFFLYLEKQVVDTCMVEGAAYVGSWLFASRDMFVWGKPRGENVLDSGAFFYETYKTRDGKVGAGEF
jgi:crotonobetainyl-CoA:carnitine CoA-transferase CaiB-like acyl-CoA transferase